MSSEENSNYFPTLDGWRAVAITLVLLTHALDSIQASLRINITDIEDTIKSFGLLGVQLFFGLSGFLITSKLLIEEAQNDNISLTAFYIRRTFRILPAALFFLATVALMSAINLISISTDRWLSTIFFMANYTNAEYSWYVGHFWSLAVEEHFYFIWPAAFILLRTTQRRVSAVVVTAFAVAFWRAIDFKLQITNSTPAIFWGRTDIQVDGILWGAFIALLYANPKWNIRIKNILSNILSLTILLISLVLIQINYKYDWKTAFFLITLKSIIIPMILLGTLIQGNGLIGRILEKKPIKIVGRLSYSLYLWQQIFLVWDKYQAPNLIPLQYFPINFIVVFSCATISMIFIEKPLIRLGHRISNIKNKSQSRQEVKNQTSIIHLEKQ